MLAQNKKAAEEKLQKENRRQLSELSKQPGNNICCDCTAQRMCVSAEAGSIWHNKPIHLSFFFCHSCDE